MTEICARKKETASLTNRIEGLRQYLLDGKRSPYNVEVAAQRDGVCIRTLRRAKFQLGVVSTKESISGAWYWVLLENQAAG